MGEDSINKEDQVEDMEDEAAETEEEAIANVDATQN